MSASRLSAARQGPPLGPVPDFAIPGSTDFYLKECSKLPEARKPTCYIRGLLAEVEKTNDPARTLPRIDDDVHRNGGYLESNCQSSCTQSDGTGRAGTA